MVGNKKVYRTRIGQIESSTKIIREGDNYVLRTKILKNYGILPNSITVHKKISTLTKTALQI